MINNKKIIKNTIFTIMIVTILILSFFTYKYMMLKRKETEDEKIREQSLLQEEQLKAENELKEAQNQKYLEENVYDNKIPISLYLNKGGTLVRADKVYCDWTRDEILGLFYALPSTDQEIKFSSINKTLKIMWENYNTKEYKIGYSLKLYLDTGETINRTMLEPIYVNDDIFKHIQLYMYDDVTNYPGRRYYHMSPEEMVEETLLTSLKLVGYKETKGVNGPIELTVFTYNGPEDFNSQTGEYMGNSKFTAKIYREQI